MFSTCHLIYYSSDSFGQYSKKNSKTDDLLMVNHRVMVKVATVFLNLSKSLARFLLGNQYSIFKHSNWDEILTAVTFAFNTSNQETTGFSPFFLLYAREPNLLIDVLLHTKPNTEHVPENNENNVTMLNS